MRTARGPDVMARKAGCKQSLGATCKAAFPSSSVVGIGQLAWGSEALPPVVIVGRDGNGQSLGSSCWRWCRSTRGWQSTPKISWTICA